MASGRILGEMFDTPDYKLWVDWRSVVDNMRNSSLVTAEIHSIHRQRNRCSWAMERSADFGH